jgi:hypothetical protein
VKDLNFKIMYKKKYLLLLLAVFYISSIELHSQRFVEQSTTLINASNGEITWGDYNNDGYLDILLTGWAIGPGPTSKIYLNNKDNTFTEQTDIELYAFQHGQANWVDFDGDGDLDIFITGYNALVEGNGLAAKFYRNEGDNKFLEEKGFSVPGVYDGSTDFGDYDNDGDMDLLITGGSNPSHYTGMFKNEGLDGFIEQTDIKLKSVSNESMAIWGDYDNDGDLDITLAGYSETGAFSAIYKNNGDNTFTEQKDILLPQVFSASNLDWGDYDNDNDLDLLFVGYTNNGYVANVYRNLGNNNFEAIDGISMELIAGRCAGWGDYDNDGDLDILQTGSDDIGSFSYIYINNGNNTLTKDSLEKITGLRGSSEWGDYDNDGDIDLLIMGFDSDNDYTKIYKNMSTEVNSRPNVIDQMSTTVNGNEVTFSWTKATDPNQSDGLNYNLYIYNSDSSKYLRPGHVFERTKDLNGKRLISASGQIQQTIYTMTIPDGNYKWSVQAIDACFEGGEFSIEKSLVVGSQSSILNENLGEISFYPNPVETILSIDNLKNYSRISVVDIYGRVAMQTNIFDKNIEIDFSRLTSGIYLINLFSNNRHDTIKVIKK